MPDYEAFSENLISRLKNLEGILFDVDGVLTDGRIIYSEDGHELKHFHVQDGASLKMLMQHNVAIGIITGRRSPIVARRARELGIEHVRQGSDSKAEAIEELIAEGFPGGNLAAVGDDMQDLGMFQHPAVGVSITVPAAHPAIAQTAHITTRRQGGQGVVVDIAEWVLRAKGQWPF